MPETQPPRRGSTQPSKCADLLRICNGFLTAIGVHVRIRGVLRHQNSYQSAIGVHVGIRGVLRHQNSYQYEELRTEEAKRELAQDGIVFDTAAEREDGIEGIQRA